jgi:hypothetical protein
MFCTQCGHEVELHARFCSKCGQEATTSAVEVAGPMPPRRVEHDMNMHISILGWLLIGSGILTALVGMFLFFFGQIFGRFVFSTQHEMPPGVPGLVSSLMTVIGLSVLALAAATAGAGVGLLQYKSWARIFAIVIAVLLVFHFPIGTAVAVYAFWVLFSKEGEQYYRSRSESTMTASGT